MQTSLQNMTHLHHTKSHRTQPKHTPKLSFLCVLQVICSTLVEEIDGFVESGNGTLL